MASGLLLALAFPPHDAVVLLPLALVPWAVALAAEPSRLRALLSGALLGLSFWCASVSWVSFVVTHYGGQPPAMGIVCVFLLALILAEWPALVGWATAAVAPPGSWRRLATFPFFWAATEHARSIVYGGFPWNLTGSALARRPLWIQSASVWGVYGVGLAIVAISSLLALAIVRRRPALLAYPALLVLGLGVFGAVRLSRSGAPPASSAGADSAVVAMIQPNVTEEDRATLEGAEASYAAVIDRGLAAAAAGADLIAFPESAFPVTWKGSARLREDLLRVARACRCAVLFNDIATDPDGAVSNSARLVTPDGLAPGIYRKVHLVPFGEYVPLPRLFFFARRISRAIGEFTAAPEPVVLSSGRFSLGVGICYEITYPPLARRQTSDGANLLGTISNDSWYGRAGAQEQHFEAALMRAVENGRWLFRSAITGISGIVDDKGRIVGELRADTAGTLRGVVRLENGQTPWTKWGHGLPFAFDGIAVVMLIFGIARRRRAPASPIRPRAKAEALDGDTA